MQHLKLENWWIGEFVVSFFDVTNRLIVHSKRNFPFFTGCGGLIRMVKSAHVQISHVSSKRSVLVQTKLNMRKSGWAHFYAFQIVVWLSSSRPLWKSQLLETNFNWLHTYKLFENAWNYGQRTIFDSFDWDGCDYWW